MRVGALTRTTPSVPHCVFRDQVISNQTHSRLFSCDVFVNSLHSTEDKGKQHC
jgi:hypothetical protein